MIRAYVAIAASSAHYEHHLARVATTAVAPREIICCLATRTNGASTSMLTAHNAAPYRRSLTITDCHFARLTDVLLLVGSHLMLSSTQSVSTRANGFIERKSISNLLIIKIILRQNFNVARQCDARQTTRYNDVSVSNTGVNMATGARAIPARQKRAIHGRHRQHQRQ
ncbi:PREDICTED: uncharacterized protein LOC105563314 isoform X1 [Vollenhovia emeryi]|uniref:uncharacterized protein LOC105563314 isoform X1 n=1 Tax=Vollenhovia emeryi TaxID=411798 RepID=UPI0005F41490|nr:PREDICTED: uncharacterized protein LOC105563314 isoform X1 [Vollenhovia emeryi]